jgi:hypothetical protein
MLTSVQPSPHTMPLKTYRSSILQDYRCATRVLVQEMRNIINMGIKYNPAALFVAVLCNLRSVNVCHP